MRITEIEINNFRAFYGKHTISLDKDGKNLMVYGENGSGKSSFYLALKTFFESAVKPVDLKSLENIFVSDEQEDSSYLQLKIAENIDVDPEPIKIDIINNQVIGDNKIIVANANKIKGFFDYKSLLKTHLVSTSNVNLFDLLIINILSEQENRFTNNKIGAEWQKIHYDSHQLRQGVHVRNRLRENITNFNLGITEKIQSIEADTNTFIETFGYNIKVKLIYNGISYHGRRDLRDTNIDVDIEFFDKTIAQHQNFLNEARLSALAISLYLATVKSNPSVGVLKTLVLDDILIGLDMNNRMPLLKIIELHFLENYQIFMTTYDRVWFEVVKSYFGSSNWLYIDIYAKQLKDNDFEIPIVKNNNNYLEKAQEYLAANDYKASAVYVRSEFERLLTHICNQKNIWVKYKTKTKELKSDDFWKAIKLQSNITDVLVQKVELCRGTVMNPFSHHSINQPQFKIELENSIAVIQELSNTNLTKVSVEGLNRKINQLEAEVNAKELIIQHQRQQINDNAAT